MRTEASAAVAGGHPGDRASRPVCRRSTGGPAVESPDTTLVRASALGGRMDGLFHSEYHRAVLGPLRALPASRRTTVGKLAERVFWPPMFKRIRVEDPQFGLPFFGTSALMRADPDASYLLARRTPGIEDLASSPKLRCWCRRSGQLNGLIGHAILPVRGCSSAVLSRKTRSECFCSGAAEAGYLFRLSLVGVRPPATQGPRVRFLHPPSR